MLPTPPVQLPEWFTPTLTVAQIFREKRTQNFRHNALFSSKPQRLPHRFLINFQAHRYITIAHAERLHLLDFGRELLVHGHRLIEGNLDANRDEGGGTKWSLPGPIEEGW